jgi:hypothetical protein
MGWPKKNEGFRLYKDSKKCFLLLDPVYERGGYVGIAETLIDPIPDQPMLASTSVSHQYIYNRKRVSWIELPEVWKISFSSWLAESPEAYRGLWRIGEREEYVELMTTPSKNLPLLLHKQWRYKHIRDLYQKQLKGE